MVCFIKSTATGSCGGLGGRFSTGAGLAGSGFGGGAEAVGAGVGTDVGVDVDAFLGLLVQRGSGTLVSCLAGFSGLGFLTAVEATAGGGGSGLPAKRLFKKLRMMNTPRIPISTSMAEIKIGSMVLLLFVMTQRIRSDWQAPRGGDEPFCLFFQFGVTPYALYRVGGIGLGAIPADLYTVVRSRLGKCRFR